MKKLVAVLMCLMMIPSVVSCEKNENPDTLSQNENTVSDSVESDSTNTTSTQTSKPEKAMEMYKAAINDEINVIDRDLGEIKLSDCIFPNNNLRLGDCEFLKRAVLDMDGDGSKEYIIQSEAKDHIVLRYYNGKVYSFGFDSDSFHNLNTDGSFYWRRFSDSEEPCVGLNQLSFDGSSLSINEVYKIIIDPVGKLENTYYMGGKQITRDEYGDYYNNNTKRRASFSPFDVSCEYPISSEVAYALASNHWGTKDGDIDGACGTTLVARIVISEKPNGDTMSYRICLQAEAYSHADDGWESRTPKITVYDELLVNAITGECFDIQEVCPAPEKAMEMYKAAINDEICVFDERLGEAKLKSLRLPGNDINLDECKLLTKAILDIDQDGVSEYVIKSPDNDCIILHYNDEKVYSYRLDSDDFYNFNTDGTFYWYDSSEAGEWECGLNRIVFDGETINVKSIYSLKFSPTPTKYEYFVEGKSVTENEYYDYRNNNLHKKSMKFSQFELTCSYPVTAEQAWILANAYWDYQDGSTDGAAGTTFTSRIVLIDTPNPETDYYRFAFQVESTSNGGGEGDECKPPYQVNSYDQILVNASTGEIIASTYEQGGKGVSVEEAIEIAKNDCEDIDFDNEGNVYRVEHAVNESAPDHVYVIVIQKYVVDHYSAYTKKWVDKNTGEIIFPYYMNGK